MTEKQSKKPSGKKQNETLLFAVKLTITVFAAFIAALCFRRSAGIIAMTPLAFIICGCTAFIGIEAKLKLVIFGLTVFAVNTVEQPDMKITLIFTALCLLATGLCEIAARLIKKRKKSGYGVLGIGAVLCIGLSVILVGNPITAIGASSALNDYTAAKYPDSENAALGEFEFSDVYYNLQTGAYETAAVSSRYPTESGIITYDNGSIRDGFEPIMKQKLSEPYVLEISELLRKYFPDENFIVQYDELSSMPGDTPFSAQAGELRGNIEFEIILGGVQTANTMIEKVERYIQVIDDADIGYSRIVFKSGTGTWMVRSVTVNGSRPLGFDKFLVEHVHPGTSNRFNRYVSELISIS